MAEKNDTFSSPGFVPSSGAPKVPMTATVWLICIIASIGFAFDIYELLMLPLVLRPALTEMQVSGADIDGWIGWMFFVPAFAGGIFGLLGGYLTDRLGRRFVLTWSILLYAVSAFLAGYSTNPWMLLVLRCTTFIGVCVEFVAAVAWLAELFPNSEQREKVLGYTQAFSSIGGLLVAVANSWCVNNSGSLPAIGIPEALQSLFGTIGQAGQHAPWRYTLMSGLIPAIPLLIIRPFLPESPIWAHKRKTGTLRRPSIMELFSPQFRRTTIVTTVLFACSYGIAFGAIQQLTNMVPGLEVAKAKAAADSAEAVKKAKEKGEDDKTVAKLAGAARGKANQKITAEYTKVQEVGGLVGRFLLAFLAVRIVSRQRLLRLFQIPSLLITPAVFWFILQVENREFVNLNLTSIGLGDIPLTTVSLMMLVVGLLTVAQFSFWGNYLPRVYPVHLRGTGESFAANIGGRMIGTSFALVTSTIAGTMVDKNNIVGTQPQAYSATAAGVALFVIVVGLICSFMLPEPSHDIHD